MDCRVKPGNDESSDAEVADAGATQMQHNAGGTNN
jgi:hypothetical protein